MNLVKTVLITTFLTGLTACQPQPSMDIGSQSSKAIVASGGDASNPIADTITDSTRLPEHIKRDIDRKPAHILQLSGVKPGDKVAELAAGSGYYSALLSRLVGNSGTVYVVDPERAFKVYPSERETFPKYINRDPRENVEYSVQNLDDFSVPEPLDSIFMVLYYHDTVYTGENREKMNRAFFNALRPGGTYLVVDHHGKTGAGDEITKSLHRMDASPVINEITQAGFVLIKNSDIFRNADDPRDVSVFDAKWRGKTDRFVYLFQKPEN